MSLEKVRSFMAERGMEDHITVREDIVDTVEHAAQSIGCESAQIAKTMSFLVDEKPILVVMAGDAKVSGSKFKSEFHQKAKMIPVGEVETLIGHEPGAVCPFAVNDDVKIYLDVSMKRFKDMHTAGGDLFSTVHVSMDELEECSGAEKWIDLCKGWLAN